MTVEKFTVFILIGVSATGIVFMGLFAWKMMDYNNLLDEYNSVFFPTTTVVTGTDGTNLPAVTDNPPAINYAMCPMYPEPQPISVNDLSELSPLFKWLDEYMETVVNNFSRPSVSASLFYRDKVLWRGNLGKLNKTSTQAPTSDTIYRIGSISKIFPVLMLFKLWEDGKVQLDDPLTKYAPDFNIGRPFKSKSDITLRDIASQISDIPRSLPYDILTGSPLLWNGTLEEAFQLLSTQIVVAEPRSTCVYSNMAYSILADTLARNFTPDRDFEKWSRKNIISPLGLQNTGFEITFDVIDRMATGYTPSGVEALLYDLLWYRPAGNYYSTCNDLAKMAMSLMEVIPDRVLNHESLKELLTPVKKCQSDYFSLGTGSPWEIDYQHNRTIVRKDGDIAGYSSTLAMVPNMKLGLVVLMSGTRNENVAQKALNQILPLFINLLKRKEYPVLPTVDFEKYLGLYEIPTVQYLNITSKGDGVLYMTNARAPTSRFNPFALSYINDGVLRISFLGGEFPCKIGLTNLETQNGALVNFRNISNGHFQLLDFPALDVYGFARVDKFSFKDTL